MLKCVMSSSFDSVYLPGPEDTTQLTGGHQPVGPPGQDCLLVLYALDPALIGRQFLLVDLPLSVGRSAQNTIMLRDPSISRYHCRIEQHEDGYLICDLGSRNGSRLNGQKVEIAPLQQGDHIKIGTSILKFLGGQDIELQYHETLFRMAMIDGPTGIHNKRYFMETLEREISQARRYGSPLSLLMLDIDHFKTVNDCFGHLAGDYVLWELAQLMTRRIRAEDTVARYGGEEFCMVLPHTERDGALALAENLRQTIDHYPFVFMNQQISVTGSVGLAQWQPSMSRMQLIEAADAMLYAAKQVGRNRVMG